MRMKLSTLSECPPESTLEWAVFTSSVGEVLVACLPQGICHLSLHESLDLKQAEFVLRSQWGAMKLKESPQLATKIAPLFAKALVGDDFNQTPICLIGSDFQIKVWKTLAQSQFGETLSYKSLGLRAGFSERHSRAVGTAVSANSVAVLIPCHRVRPASGEWGGFRWGVEIKKQLIHQERICNVERL
jgi:AraC family transcriptional regulator of adaptative response/methylated-DNA-[protein]-cysteine methyltransferase